MKKLFLILAVLLVICPKSYAAVDDNIALLTKKGFFDRPQAVSSNSNPYEETRKVLYTHLKYANCYNLDGLKSLYADNYVNADGFGRKVYFDLIKKTWESYPDIKYKIDIKNISVNGNTAIAEVNEEAYATTNTKTSVIKDAGVLKSVSGSIYYLENFNGKWLITSDHISFEKTFLGYGSAKDIAAKLIAPCQIPSGTQYTTSLELDTPKDSLVIASIGQETITYPQTVAEEVFRKMPDDGILERVFTSNTKNINEYAVASFGITKAEISQSREIRIYVTGLGFIMSRVNVIPKNNFITPDKEDKDKPKEEKVTDEKAK